MQPSIVSIGSSGVAVSQSAGSTTIMATSGSISGTDVITVNPLALMSIAVTPNGATLSLGSKLQFSARGTFSDSSTKDITALVQWSSTSGSVASVSNSAPIQGMVTAMSTGITTIAATSGAVAGSARLTITPAPLVSVAVVPPNLTLVPGTSRQFTAIGTYSNGTTQDLTDSVVWSTGNTGVARISNSPPTQGVATAITTGTVPVTATSGTVSGSTNLSVNLANLLSIAVAPNNASVLLGSNQQFTAVGTFSDGSHQDITATVNWASRQAAVAGIDNSGLITTRSLGTTTISASSGSIAGSTEIAVTNLSSTCDFSKHGTGTHATFICSITYEDATDGTVTRDVRIHIPLNYAPGNALVFFLHGGGGSYYDGEGYTNFTPKSDAIGFVMLYPQGTIDNTPEHKRTWNVLLQNGASAWAGPAPDDVNFVRQIINLIQANLGTDPKQVFVTGLSVGGLMTHRLGIELSDLVAAIAPVSSSLHEENAAPHSVTEAARAPVSVLMFHGNQDREFPYCGVNVPQAYVAGQDETFSYWTGPLANNCTIFDTTASFCNSGVINNSIYEKDATGCDGNAEVKHYELVNGRHLWYDTITNTPPGTSRVPYNPDVNNSTGIAETDIVWNFFSTHTK